jgi:hypothetical protein
LKHKGELTDYLSEGRHEVPIVLWILSKLDREGELFKDGFLASLGTLAKDHAVKAFLELLAKLGTKDPQSLCRTAGKRPSIINSNMLKDLLEEKDKNGAFLLSLQKRSEVVKALICSLSGVHPDDLEYKVFGEQSVRDMFNNTIALYCQQWSTLDPNIIAD